MSLKQGSMRTSLLFTMLVTMLCQTSLISPANASGNRLVGEVITFAGNYCPKSSLEADGRLLPVSQFSALFSILGPRFGGDGRTTFALPNLKNRNGGTVKSCVVIEGAYPSRETRSPGVAPTQAPAQMPSTAGSSPCRKHLNGPNKWLNNQAKNYGSAVAEKVCGPLETSTKPAECFHYVMSGQVAWDKRGMTLAKPNTYTRWGLNNAVDLCAGAAQGTGLVQCFGLHVARGRTWRDATAHCKQLN